VNIHALLCAANAVSVYYADGDFIINNEQMLFYGAFACFEMPVDDAVPV
jgi:hypothetical protein